MTTRYLRKHTVSEWVTIAQEIAKAIYATDDDDPRSCWDAIDDCYYGECPSQEYSGEMDMLRAYLAVITGEDGYNHCRSRGSYDDAYSGEWRPHQHSPQVCKGNCPFLKSYIPELVPTLDEQDENVST